MNTKNRFLVFLKRILTRKLYLALLAAILFLTVIYLFLPEKKQSADIKVAVFCEDSSRFSTPFYEALENNSVYTFYIAENEEQVIRDVKSKKAECGFVFPEGFFEDYIAGLAKENPAALYTVPSTTLSETIAETVFSRIFEVCAPDLLYTAANIPEYNLELGDRLAEYMNGNEIFRIKDNSDGKYLYETLTYRLSLPVFELSLILLFFSGMLGLLTHMQDAERGIYLALSKKERLGIMATLILASLVPIFCVGFFSVLITYHSLGKLLFLSLAFLCTFSVCFLLGLFIKKSSLFVKLLPLMMLFTTALVFLNSLF